jgi:hypothetical protein
VTATFCDEIGALFGGVVGDSAGPPGAHTSGIVSCDIVGHSAADVSRQLSRVAELNEIVASTIATSPAGQVVWASGGDGGHVLFLQKSWQQPALDLILALRTWSDVNDVPLRITGHHGVVASVPGADGRVQMVGNAINYAGWLLTQVTHEGIVVSDAFRREIVVTETDPVTTFSEPRSIPHTELPPQLLFLMSTDGFQSEWGRAPQGDHDGLEFAVAQGGGWDLLYFAKRIWQVNSTDRDVMRALEDVRPDHLRYQRTTSEMGDVNPFFGHLSTDELQEVLRFGQLVERRRGEFVCRYDEPGDTMWVILRGRVGVYNSEGDGFGGTAKPKHVQQQGEIVGELAFALSRNRTADLVALTDVALLSFSYEDAQLRMAMTKVGETAARQVSAFINYRVLQHVGDNAPYLLGTNRTGPLAMGSRPWEYALAVLRKHCELLVVDTRSLDLVLDDIAPPASRGRGLYILVAGAVRTGDSRNSLLKGKDFPVLWTDVPNLVPAQPGTYRVHEEPVKVLRIAAEGLEELEAPQRQALRRTLPRALASPADKYEFDVFLCHSKRDWPLVSQVRNRLARANISCWVDEEHTPPGISVTESMERGLRSSRYLLACVSADFAQSAWAQHELRAILHLDVQRRSGNSILVLMLNEHDGDDLVPLFVRDAKRINYANAGEFDALMTFLQSRDTAAG